MAYENDYIDKYLIKREINRGSMGVIFLGEDPDLGREVAIKTLNRSISKDPDYQKRFINEAKIASKLDHPNVVRIFDAGIDDQQYFIIMEYVPMGSLYDQLKKEGGVLSLEVALDVIIDIAEALEAAHKRKLVHRDIKPDNIMLGSNGDYKLADLGLAKALDDDVQLTLTGMTIGTPLYMSPEQVKDAKSADIRSDIYSLGATFYQLITGVVPFDGDNTIDVLMCHLDETLESPQRVNIDIPDTYAAIIIKMMEKRAGDRYQSPSDLLVDLRRLEEGCDLGDLQAQNLTARSTQIPKYYILFLIFFGIILLLFLVFFALNDYSFRLEF